MGINIRHLIEHPEAMDRETLYDLRSLLALHPYYQTARLLLLKNLYLLHDPGFDQELRRAAIWITDRKALFEMVEAGHYRIKKTDDGAGEASTAKPGNPRTIALIDNFLESIPKDEEAQPKEKNPKRKPTAVDATTDYVAYLMEISQDVDDTAGSATLKGQTLIDDFIYKEGGKIKISQLPPPLEDTAAQGIKAEEENGGENTYESVCTETLAKIYIKQGRYGKAFEIIRQLNLNNTDKNAYFADQMRFLEKLMLISKTKKQQ